jgi:Flp pilus assembly protein TadD
MLAFLFTGCDKIFSEVKVLEENDKGILAMNEGDSEGSLVHFHNAMDLKPEDKETKSTIYRNIALAHSDLMDDDSAILYHKKAANCYGPGEYYYLINMADADLFAENIGSAVSRLLKAQSLDPNEVVANNILGLIYLG